MGSNCYCHEIICNPSPEHVIDKYAVEFYDRCNKGCSLCYPVCGKVHMKDWWLLVERVATSMDWNRVLTKLKYNKTYVDPFRVSCHCWISSDLTCHLVSYSNSWNEWSSNCPSHIPQKTHYTLDTNTVTSNDESCDIPLGKLFDGMSGIQNCPSHITPKKIHYTLCTNTVTLNDESCSIPFGKLL